jgi:hypothetical protein
MIIIGKDMKNITELKKFCDEKIKKYPDLEEKYKKEISLAKRYYNNDINLYEELFNNKEKIKKQYVIPFLLGFTDEVVDKEFEYKFLKEGSSGGADIDSDFDSAGKEKIFEYLRNKFGEDRVLSVGTFSRLGPSAAAKDLLRVYKIDFKESNSFTRLLDPSLSWEENLKTIKEENPVEYKIYLKHKDILDLTPHFIGKIRQVGKHAGGVVILDRPVYDLIPVERVSGELATAFPESSQDQVLDEIGVVKFDILSISILDVIRNTINSINEKLFLIEEDGIKKIVGESYINKEINQF